MAESILTAGATLSAEDAMRLITADDSDLLDILAGAYRIRRHFYGNHVKMNYLINAKSGICPEDCHYCSQSRISEAPIARYKVLEEDQIVARAEHGLSLSASTCCIVLSGRTPRSHEIETVAAATRRIKDTHPDLKVCACMGFLNDEQAAVLKNAGVDRYNHNLNTADDHYGNICTTHGFDDRVNTVQTVQKSGMSPCSGVIVGMGESYHDLINVAFTLRDLDVDSIPINFLLPIDGTPLATAPGLGDPPTPLTPTTVLKVLSLFRFICPQKEIRVSAGREVHLGGLQALSLYPANALFVSDYLTEPGQPADMDFSMIQSLGFIVEPLGVPMGPQVDQ